MSGLPRPDYDRAYVVHHGTIGAPSEPFEVYLDGSHTRLQTKEYSISPKDGKWMLDITNDAGQKVRHVLTRMYFPGRMIQFSN